jgi:hypothetical protein
MSRNTRLFIPNFYYHTIQRGNRVSSFSTTMRIGCCALLGQVMGWGEPCPGQQRSNEMLANNRSDFFPPPVEMRNGENHELERKERPYAARDDWSWKNGWEYGAPIDACRS